MTLDVEPSPFKLRILGRDILSDTLILAALPVSAYMLVFAYYSGWFGVFNLPVQLISLTLRDVFLVTGALVGLISIPSYLGDILFSLFGTLPHPLGQRFRTFTLEVFALVLFLYLYPIVPPYHGYLDFWQVVLGIAIMALINFFPPLRTQGTYLERLQAADGRSQQRMESTREPIEKLARRLRPEFVMLAFLVFFAYSAGRFNAMRQTEFYVADTSPETVVLWMTDDKAIAAPVTRASRDVEPSFLILKLDGDPTIRFRYEAIGSLHLKGDSQAIVRMQTAQPTPTSTATP